MPDPLSSAREAYQHFAEGFRSVVLATVDGDGKPSSSYAPCVVDADGIYWCLVSGLSVHTRNVLATGRASALFIEDESAAAQIFARRRLTYECRAEVLARDHEAFPAVRALFELRFGEIAAKIASMPDFRPLRLQPGVGQFVIGFGAAYRVEDGALVHQAGGSGHGHGHGHGAGESDEGLTEDAVAGILEHMNTDHAAAVLHYAREHGGLGEAQTARLLGLDGAGMDIAAITPEGERRLRVAFSQPIGSRAEAREVLMAMARSSKS